MIDILNSFSDKEMAIWLLEALGRKRALPLITPDEPPYLAIARLEKSLAPHARRSVDAACLQLLNELALTKTGDPEYLVQLILFASKLKNIQIIPILSKIALGFPAQPSLDVQVCQIILGVLVDAPTPQPVDFWQRILNLNVERFSGIAFAGILRVNPAEAISMLPSMPKDERIGRVVAMNLDLRYDSLTGTAQSSYLEGIQSTLARCDAVFAKPILKWVAKKNQMLTAVIPERNLLAEALDFYLGAAAAARRLTPKLFTLELEPA